MHASENGKVRDQAFRDELCNCNSKGRPFTKVVHKVANYWEGEAKDFTKKEYWDDKQILQAGLKGAFSILRLLASQLAHAVVAEQTEDEADKAGP